ncbi:Y-family DNA polymerase [Tautonia rosea]|uniref:Y-family DNA polymerase n=1 Tax=Tautonia rosea TaxID=2728037 RepID=UPI0014767A66|nr:Y-family DNA polymerase [Tautonia rosea]
MFALVDCNNFYASCERVFNPTLRARPVVVLSNNDGCIIARSQEAKDLGLKMGQPYFEARPLITKHGVAVFSSNYALYGDMSRRVMETLERFSPGVEAYSIDEAFLDLTHVPAGRLIEHGRELRETVARWTGIPVGVGIAPTKTLAKIANHRAKRDPEAAGVAALPDRAAWQPVLETFPIEDVWGIGRRWAAMLSKHEITTAAGFAAMPDLWIKRRTSVIGLRTAWELRGEPCLELEMAPPARKCLMVSRSFGKKLEALEPIAEALTAHVARAGEKLRAEGLVARHLMVLLQTSRHADPGRRYSATAQASLMYATSTTPALLREAIPALERIYRPGFLYAKCGVMLTELTPASSAQPSLFEGGDTPDDKAVMEVVDGLNRRMGKGTIAFGGSGLAGRPWHLSARMRSPRFTTRIEEVPVANCHIANT